MAKRLTSFSKFLITLLIVGGIFLGGRYLLQNTEVGQDLQDKTGIEQEKSNNTATNSNNTNSESSTTTAKVPPGKALPDDGDVLKVQVFTWGGYAPGFYFNNGFEPNERSRFYKEYGLKVKFILMDDFNASRQAWKADEVHLIGSTADALSTEMEGLGQYRPQIVMQTDWSRGGDAIIAKRGINNINDLRGKKVAYTPTTPSQTFLIKMLDAAGLKMKDINSIEMPDNIAAATAFKSGKVDAAVVWSPDDEIAVREVKGAKVLQSTREASHIIADVFVAKKAFVDKNRDKINKFYEGWMKAAAEINANDSNKKLAAKLMAQGTGIPEQDAYGAIENTRLTTHGDNKNFFGLNVDYKGVTGEELYNKMGDRFESLGFAKKGRPDWRRTAYSGGVSAATLSGQQHAAEGQKVYKAPTVEDRVAEPVATKRVSINFDTNQSELSENAKTIIDLEMADIAKAFGNMRVRIEGNTDDTGSDQVNIPLSEKRARSVAKYLEKEYGMNANRFVIIGNGSKNPVAACKGAKTNKCRAQNRRTEFQLIAG